jgi:Putative capsular polysaccharide synthesis protein
MCGAFAMSNNKTWWFISCDRDTIADFHRRSALILDLGENVPAHHPGCELRFERELAVGDLVLAGNRDDDTIAIGRIEGDALRRPGIRAMQVVRSIHWYRDVAVDRLDSDIVDEFEAAPAVSMLSEAAAVKIETLLVSPMDAAEAAEAPQRSQSGALESSQLEPDAACFGFDIQIKPEPLLPILYQSPYAERILRDFRWREYLRANPDVAATGDDEAHAFNHFFHQGYYERRIFDSKRLDGFDPGYYRARYPELDLIDDAQAQIHYCYQGYYDARVSNADTGWLYDADLHVFQMGKVGSHSIGRALHDAGYEGRLVHVHWTTDLYFGYPSCRLPYSQILAHSRETPVRVISGVRDIVSWTLSGLFQYHGHHLCSVADMKTMIEERFWEQCRNGLRWFDHGYFCGLDVYAHPFDHAVGYARIEHDPIALFVYRQEHLDRLAEPMAGFVGLPQLRLSAYNDGSRKAYAELYAGVLRDFRLPGNLLSTLYDSPFMRHFYSDAERERGYARWVRG